MVGTLSVTLARQLAAIRITAPLSWLPVFVNDANMLGTSLFGYAKNVVREVIPVGPSGTLVDWEGDYEQRAYATAYRAEDILNWRVGRVNGRNAPTPRVWVAQGRAP